MQTVLGCRMNYVQIAADSTYEEVHYATQMRGSCEEHHWRRTLDFVLLKSLGLTNSETANVSALRVR